MSAFVLSAEDIFIANEKLLALLEFNAPMLRVSMARIRTNYFVPVALAVPAEHVTAEGAKFMGQPLHGMEGITVPHWVVRSGQNT